MCFLLYQGIGQTNSCVAQEAILELVCTVATHSLWCLENLVWSNDLLGLLLGTGTLNNLSCLRVSTSSFITSDTADPESIIISVTFPANSPVRIAALHFTADTVTTQSLLGPTGKRDAHSSKWMPRCSFPANSSSLHGLVYHKHNSDGFHLDV